MEARDMLLVIGRLRTAGIDAWVDGGWGIDALVGRQTRPHEDLDLVVALGDVAAIREVLGSIGFESADDELPVRFVLAHPDLGRIDFHTVSFDEQGGGLQLQPNGATFRYPPEGFVTGSIANESVRCISAEVQILCHLGYTPTEKDFDDMRKLEETLGVTLPPPYTR